MSEDHSILSEGSSLFNSYAKQQERSVRAKSIISDLDAYPMSFFTFGDVRVVLTIQEEVKSVSEDQIALLMAMLRKVEDKQLKSNRHRL